MRLIYRLLSVPLAIALMFTVQTTIAVAGTQGHCTKDSTVVLLWENSIGDTSDGNDNLYVCISQSDLTMVAHTLAGDCQGAFAGQPNWNDCVNSYTMLGGGWCFYSDVNYNGLFDSRGGTGRFDLIYGDVLSSVKNVNNLNCP